MKTIFLKIILMVMFLLPISFFAQTFTCTIQNQTLVGTDFSFDICMLRTGATEIYLASSDFVVTFNDANFTSPTYELIQLGELGSKLNSVAYGGATSIQVSNRAVLSINAPAPGTQPQFDAAVQVISNSGLGTLIAKVKITGANGSGSANIQWRTDSPNNTFIATFANTTPWGTTNISGNGTYTDPSDYPFPVELSSFTASINQSNVSLKWQTETEVDNYGFEVERKAAKSGKEVSIWEKIGFVEGNGNSNSPKKYSLMDKYPTGGSKFVYRLKQIDNDGKFEYSKEVEVELVPNEFILYQNYPNPFNPATNVKFALPKTAKVTLLVYNLLGEKVATLLNEDKEAGFYDVEFNASSLSTGMYIYRITAGDFVQTKKMTLIK